MKLLLITLFSLLQIESRPDYKEFEEFIGKFLRPPFSVTSNCEWQYAVVKFHTNKRNLITRYSLLNNPVKELGDSFKFLIGHRLFNHNEKLEKDYVFCVSIENHKSECSGNQRQIMPSEVLSSTLGYYNIQYKKNPKTIFIYDVVDIAYSFDMEK